MSDAATAIRLARQLATVLRRMHYYTDANNLDGIVQRFESVAPPDPVTRNTPEQQRKIASMMAARTRALRYVPRTYPKWTKGMLVKEYVRQYRMENQNAACFKPGDIYFLEGNE